MAKYTIDSSTLETIADSIRSKSGLTGSIKPEDMPSRIMSISSNGGSIMLQSKNATPSEAAQTIMPDSGYVGLSSVSVDAISKTYVGSNVTRKSAQTYTPKTSAQTIAAGQYLTGAQTISGDTNLIPSNIRSGVEIFGVTGSYTGSENGTVQRKSGTIAYTDTEGGFFSEINCGFVPDVVLIKGQQGTYSGYNMLGNASFVFGEDSRETNDVYQMVWVYTPRMSNASMCEIWSMQKTNGFSVLIIYKDGTYNQVNVGNQTLEYVALKYT